jgi:hypothetical protein
MDKIQNIIYKYNPINLLKNDLILYDNIVQNIYRDFLKNKLTKDFQYYFVEYFGEDTVLFNMRKQSNIYNLIYNEINELYNI